MLPIDRTAKAVLDANLVNGILSDGPKIKASEDVVYNTIDELNNKVNTLISSDVLTELGIINVKDYNASGSANTYTGSIASGTKILTLGPVASLDFAAGQGINLQGVFEVSSLNITAAATASGNVTVTLNGVAFTVAVLSGDSIATVATKIRNAVFVGWATAGSNPTITFTSTSTGVKTDATYSAGTTGATGTMTTTTQGVADQVSIVSSLSGLVVNIADNASRTIPAGTVLHDDRAAIQAALKVCFDNNLNLVGSPGTYLVSGTIYFPSNPTFGKLFEIDFSGMTFQVAAGVTLFESGIYSGGAWSSTFDEPNDTHMSFGVKLRGFRIIGGRYGIRLSNWHQGCTVENITSSDCETALHAKNCYYAKLDDIVTSVNAAPPYTGTRFMFSEQCNLMSFSGLVAVNSAIGYRFLGPLTACQLTNISFEGMAVGVQFDSEVYNCVIENSYMEAVSDTVIKCLGLVDNLTLRNNYVNFISQANMYFVDYVPLPLNNIIIEQDNMFVNMTDDSKIFKTKDNSPNYNNVTFKRPPGYTNTLSDLLVDNANFSNQAVMKKEFNLLGAKANLVNKFAVGNYSGKFTDGFAGGVPGCARVNNINNVLTLNTRLVSSDTQRIYVNLKIAANAFNYIKGEFVGSVFYEYGATGVTVTSNLAIAVVGGYLQITSAALVGNVTGVDGEVRLM